MWRGRRWSHSEHGPLESGMQSRSHCNVCRRPPLGRWLLALLVVECIPSAVGRTLLRRFDLSRKNVVSHQVDADAVQAPATSQHGIEVQVVVKADVQNSSTEEVADAVKFHIANEGMRSQDLQNFLASYGVDPKAKLPPVHEDNPGGEQVPLPVEGVDMSEPEAAEAKSTVASTVVAATPTVDGNFLPAGYQTTAPPWQTTSPPEGYMRQLLTTQPLIWQAALEGKDISADVQDVLMRKPVQQARVVTTAVPTAWEKIGDTSTTVPFSATPMMMIHPNAYGAVS